MNRRFTRINVKAVFDQWPQAVSADDGDLRALHDMASAGAQTWGETLRWPDYLWLDFENELPRRNASQFQKEIYDFRDPTGAGDSARFGVIAQRVDRSHFPPSGNFTVRNQPIAMIECNVVESDFVSKLHGYDPRIPWSRFIPTKLHQWFDYRLRKADEQIAGGKRLIGFHSARGIAVIINEASWAVVPQLVVGHLAKVISRYQHLHGIVYLSDRPDGPHHFSFVHKDWNDETVHRIATQLRMMFSSFSYGSGVPVSRIGPLPKLLATIEMDERSRKIYRSWATGWRRNDDPSPIPTVTMTTSFVRREEFVSGLPPTNPDPNLLDLHLRWDPEGTNLRIEN